MLGNKFGLHSCSLITTPNLASLDRRAKWFITKYIYTYIYIYICIYTYKIYIYIYTFIQICMHICVFVRVCIHRRAKFWKTPKSGPTCSSYTIYIYIWIINIYIYICIFYNICICVGCVLFCRVYVFMSLMRTVKSDSKR